MSDAAAYPVTKTNIERLRRERLVTALLDASKALTSAEKRMGVLYVAACKIAAAFDTGRDDPVARAAFADCEKARMTSATAVTQFGLHLDKLRNEHFRNWGDTSELLALPRAEETTK